MPEPWGPNEAEDYMRSQEPAMSRIILDGIRQVLDEIRAVVMAVAGVPDMNAWDGRSISWQRLLLEGRCAELINRIIRHVMSLGSGITLAPIMEPAPPITSVVVPLIVPPSTDTTPESVRSSTQAYAQQHIQTVWSRLRDWPTEAWNEVSAELDAGIAEGLDSRQLRERVGDALDITALTRTTESEMAARYERIEKGVTPAVEARLRSEIRELAGTADRSRRRWEWRADRIARTEVAAAVNAGVEAFAAESAAATGRQWYKRWWSSQDERVRATHRAAHGQIAPPGGTFTVGGASLRHPGDPLGPPQEIINCRCSTLLLTEREAKNA